MTGQTQQTAGRPFPTRFFDQRPSFCIPWGIFAERGSWHGWGLDHYGWTAFAGQGGSGPAKNSVLPLLAAALLCSGPVRLQNVPRLTDVEDCLALLQGVGCTAGWQGAALAVQGQPMRTDLAPEAAGRMRHPSCSARRRWRGWGGEHRTARAAAVLGQDPSTCICRGWRRWACGSCPLRPDSFRCTPRRGCGARRSVLAFPAWALPKHCCWPLLRRRGRPCCMVPQRNRRSWILPPSSTPAAAAWRARAPTPSGCRESAALQAAPSCRWQTASSPPRWLARRQRRAAG